VREIRTLRAMWRGLETELRITYTGTKGETPDTDKADPASHRASPRPYRG
jgi:hypothetical protein